MHIYFQKCISPFRVLHINSCGIPWIQNQKEPRLVCSWEFSYLENVRTYLNGKPRNNGEFIMTDFVLGKHNLMIKALFTSTEIEKFFNFAARYITSLKDKSQKAEISQRHREGMNFPYVKLQASIRYLDYPSHN